MKGNEIMDNKELCYMLDLDPDTVEDVDITRKDEKYVFIIVIMIYTYGDGQKLWNHMLQVHTDPTVF